MTKEPRWWRMIINLDKKDLEEFKERLHNCRTKNILCKCEKPEEEPSGCCALCWKYVKQGKAFSYWDFPSTLTPDRWVHYDNKIKKVIRGQTKKWKGLIAPLVLTRGNSWEAIRIGLFRESDFSCNNCKKNLEEEGFEVDHIIPHSQGGNEFYDNLQVLCKKCHSKRLFLSLPTAL